MLLVPGACRLGYTLVISVRATPSPRGVGAVNGSCSSARPAQVRVRKGVMPASRRIEFRAEGVHSDVLLGRVHARFVDLEREGGS